MTTALRPLPFVAYEELDDRPHVMVDGAARPRSVLTLSHWPQSPTPDLLARDLSVQIVLDFLSAAGRPAGLSGEPGGAGEVMTGAAADAGLAGLGRGRAAALVIAAAVAAANTAEAATCDHFDEDGLVALYALVDPDAALRRTGLLADVASCGDFGVVRSGVAARICFAIGPLADEEAGADSTASARYSAVLARLPELLELHERFERCWSGEWALFVAGRAALERGDVGIDEYPEADLAVVSPADSAGAMLGRQPGAAGATVASQPGAAGALPVHPAAVHSATSASRILAFNGATCELYLRYESWVRFVSRPVPLRPELEPLGLELTQKEPSGKPWKADGIGAVVARLRPEEGRTEIDPAVIVAAVRSYLASAPPAWDPFRAGGGYIPPGERSGYVLTHRGSLTASVSPRRSWRRRRRG